MDIEDSKELPVVKKLISNDFRFLWLEQPMGDFQLHVRKKFSNGTIIGDSEDFITPFNCVEKINALCKRIIELHNNQTGVEKLYFD